ncbi:hypothetical protein D3C81_1151070 [compost metagenome]
MGGASPTLWVVPNSAPVGIYTGLAALIAQTYNEANVKNGNQFELAGNTPTLAINGNIDVVFTTGDLPVIIKGRIVKFNGTSLVTRVYRNPTVTVGTGVLVPYFNLNDRNPAVGLATIRTGATVTAAGTEFGAPTFDIGTEGQGNTSVSTYSVVGNERLLAPNTVYLQRITNDSAAIQRVASYLTWFEGNTDIPL